MEEEKAAAYYDDLTRRGEGAARFKQGLGYSAGDHRGAAAPERGSALPSSSSFLSNFVRASSPSTTSKLEKQSQLQSIQNKLKKKPDDYRKKEPWGSEHSGCRSPSRERDRERDRRRDRERYSRRRSRSRSRSRSREGDRGKERDRDRRKRRSRSRSRSRSPRRERKSERTRSRSRSPRERKRSDREGDRESKPKKERSGGVDYSRLIDGYDKMSPAERVKAKMKLQLAETAKKDPNRGMGSGWERFDFDKDAPLDDEEIEAAEDDAAVLKHISQSFRFTAIEARREEQIKAAHDKAIFGAPVAPLVDATEDEPKEEKGKTDSNENVAAANLLSAKVLAKQPGSWRDRVRKT